MDQTKINYLEKVLNRFNYLKTKINISSNNINKNINDLYKEYSSIKKISELYIIYKSITQKIDETKNLLQNSDKEIKILVEEEMDVLNEKKKKQEIEIIKILIPKEENINSIFLEIRAATGGDESAIFVENLLKMYLCFTEKIKLKYNIMSLSNGNSGGYREVILRIEGNNVIKKFENESGIHRVQRIPKTDTKGRIHTSTCSVAVLPEIKSSEKTKIETNELRIDTYRSSGAGGQHVNVTDSAVRIIHIPTGVMAECQSERSQHKNKQKAMSLLLSRLISKEKTEKKESLDHQRKKIIGKGLRSEKIRTYNYTENRITDHRLNTTIYKLSEIMEGNLDLILEKQSDK